VSAEVEAVLARHPAVSEATLDGREPPVAHVRLSGARSPTRGELQRYLRLSLPDDLIPVEFVAAGIPLPDARTEPPTAVEEAIAGIWSETLGRDGLDLDADLFDLGASSLAAIRVAARLEERFGVRVPVSAVFDFPTIAGQAAYVEAGGA
jgi:acyl carrier protein